MIAPALALILGQPTTLDVARFFPLIPGTSWTFVEDISGIQQRYTETVGAPIEVGTFKQAFPIVTAIPNAPPESTFYAIQGDTVLTVAYDAKNPLVNPVPSVRWNGRRTTWKFEGRTPFLRGGATTKLSGEARLEKERTVLNRMVRVLFVQLTAEIKPDTGGTIRSVQKAWYGEGIGLIELESNDELDGFRSVRRSKLVEFTPPRTEGK